jgi:hypothetical protein
VCFFVGVVVFLCPGLVSCSSIECFTLLTCASDTLPRACSNLHNCIDVPNGNRIPPKHAVHSDNVNDFTTSLNMLRREGRKHS